MFKIVQKLGPGLLYAGAAVGVSHIVQSTKAGAQFGWLMILFVIITNILKYPFFEAGPRYANSTGKSLLHGYQKLGKWSLYLFLGLTLATMFIIQAAVTVVTAGLAVELFQIKINPDQIWLVSAVILILSVTLLNFGKLQLLSRLMKWIMLILCLTTLVAFVMSFSIDAPTGGTKSFFDFRTEHVAFLIAFLGWMPAPLDISVWHSIWSLDSGKLDLKTGLFDFKIGFWGTMLLAILFVGLGANMIYGSSILLETSAGGFAKQFINIYTSALGDWSYWIIAIAAFTTMLSTTLSCLDAYGRIVQPTIEAIQPHKSVHTKNTFWLIITAIGAIVILKYFITNMAQLVTFITIISFVSAPIIAWFNFRVMFKILPVQQRPNCLNYWISVVGLTAMTCLSLYYLSFL